MEISLVHEICVGRKWFYSLMSNAFYNKPTQEEMMPFIESNVFEALRVAGEENIHVHALADALKNMSAYGEEDYIALGQEYMMLFATSGRVMAPPWESVYRSEEYLLMDEYTLAVRKFYEKCGYQVENYAKGPEDHIGLELGFVSNLIDETIQSESLEEIRNSLGLQQQFIQEHIVQFMERFSSQVVQHGQSVFYINLAQFMVQYIIEDLQDLEDMINNLSK